MFNTIYSLIGIFDLDIASGTSGGVTVMLNNLFSQQHCINLVLQYIYLLSHQDGIECLQENFRKFIKVNVFFYSHWRGALLVS